MFGRFVGAWDVAVQIFDPAGGLRFDGIGRWDFRWILDGLGVQDVLTYALPEEFPQPRGARAIGTTIRAYLPSEGAWRQVWCAPRAGNFITMRAEPDDDGIRITGLDMDGSHLVWSFRDITDESFSWEGWSSADGRTGWRVEQRMRARRR